MTNDALSGSPVTCDEPTTMSANSGCITQKPSPKKMKPQTPKSLFSRHLCEQRISMAGPKGLAVAAVRRCEVPVQVHFVISSNEQRQLMTK